MTLGVTACNESAVKLYKNIGFEIEGVLKNQEYHFGKYQDGLRMALLNPSYTY
jgi:RimJ/RimL family protein N-acetyltransferase